MRSVEQPSTRAASSSSVGSAVTRYWRTKNTPNAEVAAGTISAWIWLFQCSHCDIMMYSGMMPSCGGTIMVAMTPASSMLRPRKRSLAKANPASVEVSTTDTVTTDETMNELMSASFISVSWNALVRLVIRFAPGSRLGGTLLICALSCEAATNVQYNGKSERNTTTASSR